LHQVESRITIDASPERIWEVLSDLTAMRDYMPGIETVALTSERSEGVGASRHCVFKDGVELSERVAQWREGAGYVLETTAFKGVPMLSNVITFEIQDSTSSWADVDAGHAGETTTVKQSMRYEMKGGIFAPLVEKMAGRMMRKALRGALEGLKAQVER